jgi:hypothetical protein
MSYTTTPTQLRYNDPYDQTIFEFNDAKMYLSKTSNRLLNVIGSDIVIKGMEMSAPTIIGTDTVRTTIASGWAIADETLIQLSATSTIDIDCSGLIDTTVGGAHLAVFLNYEHIHTAEANLAAVDLFHVESSGTVNDPFGRFNIRSCQILLGIINFTKSGVTVIACSTNPSPTLLVSGVTYYVRGLNPNNINIPNLFDVVFKTEREYLLKRDYLMSE